MKFRLVDRIVSVEPGCRIVGRKAVSFEEYSLAERGGEGPILPASLALGSLLELSCWLQIISSGYTQIAIEAEIEQVSIGRCPGRGETMTLDVHVVNATPEHTTFRGGAMLEGETLLQVREWRSWVRPLEQFCVAADLRVLFSEIGCPC